MTTRWMQALMAPLLALLCLTAAAQAPQPPEVAARSYLLLDVSANQVLAARDPDSPIEPASLTKLMTGYSSSMRSRTKDQLQQRCRSR